ncbi:ryncolin-1-like [Styela clava]
MKILGVSILLSLTLFHSANTLSCVPCEELMVNDKGETIEVKRKCPKLNCPGSETAGLCNCCNRCAKQEGETCGGDFNMEGDCEPYLRCVTRESRIDPEGRIVLAPSPNWGGRCRKLDAPSDCIDVCSKLDNNYPVGMAEHGQTAFFDYKKRSEPISQGTWMYCDCSGGAGNAGWMVIQRRYLGLESFDRDMREYVNGFGMATGDYWMGLEAIHHFTDAFPHELRITVKLEDGRKFTTYFDQFSIGDEKENFKLSISASHQKASRDFANMHNGMKFTARDSDNDRWENRNCADTYGGGWWFNRCTEYNLNGRLYGIKHYRIPDEIVDDEDGPDRVTWNSCQKWKIVQTEMAIRRFVPEPLYTYN